MADLEPRIGDWEVVAIVNDEGILLGVVRPEAIVGLPLSTPVAEVILPAPATVRPSVLAPELAESMDKDGRTHVLVTTFEGRLLGLVHRKDLLGQH